LVVIASWCAWLAVGVFHAYGPGLPTASDTLVWLPNSTLNGTMTRTMIENHLPASEANKRMEPMTGSAFTFDLRVNILGALPVMAHRHRSDHEG